MNLLKGEVSLKAGDKEYKLKFTTDALCELEERLDMAISEIIPLIGRNILRIKQIQVMLYCACMCHHEEVDLSAASAIVNEVGYTEAGIIVVKAMAASLPDRAPANDQKKTLDQVR